MLKLVLRKTSSLAVFRMTVMRRTGGKYDRECGVA
jgi:hypothetical protein